MISKEALFQHKILASTACDFELSGPEGFVESIQISGEGRALQTEAVDCRWYIKAPPRAKVCICQTVVDLVVLSCGGGVSCNFLCLKWISPTGDWIGAGLDQNYDIQVLPTLLLSKNSAMWLYFQGGFFRCLLFETRPLRSVSYCVHTFLQDTTQTLPAFLKFMESVLLLLQVLIFIYKQCYFNVS